MTYHDRAGTRRQADINRHPLRLARLADASNTHAMQHTLVDHGRHHTRQRVTLTNARQFGAVPGITRLSSDAPVDDLRRSTKNPP